MICNLKSEIYFWTLKILLNIGIQWIPNTQLIKHSNPNKKWKFKWPCEKLIESLVYKYIFEELMAFFFVRFMCFVESVLPHIFMWFGGWVSPHWFSFNYQFWKMCGGLLWYFRYSWKFDLSIPFVALFVKAYLLKGWLHTWWQYLHYFLGWHFHLWKINDQMNENR